MPDDISVKDWELLAFFEVEPTKLDANIGWPYNDFTYRRVLGDEQVTFAVAPAYKDFTLTVERGGVKRIQLSALSVFDIRYHIDHGKEWIEILLTESETLEFRIKPVLSLVGSLRSRA